MAALEQEILVHLRNLTPDQQRKVLAFVRGLEQSPDSDMQPEKKPDQPTWGASVVAMLEAMEPVELVDPEIEDSVEWVKAQRKKRADKLKPYWDGKA